MVAAIAIVDDTSVAAREAGVTAEVAAAAAEAATTATAAPHQNRQVGLAGLRGQRYCMGSGRAGDERKREHAR